MPTGGWPTQLTCRREAAIPPAPPRGRDTAGPTAPAKHDRGCGRPESPALSSSREASAIPVRTTTPLIEEIAHYLAVTPAMDRQAGHD